MRDRAKVKTELDLVWPIDMLAPGNGSQSAAQGFAHFGLYPVVFADSLSWPYGAGQSHLNLGT